MKKTAIYCLTLLVIGSLNTGFGQADWNTAGNAISSGDYLGTTNTQALVFKTNNSQRMTLLGNGSNTGWMALGLNFNGAQALFHANGIGYSTGEVFRTSGDSSVLNAWRMYTGSTANGNERFRITTLANSDGNHVYLQSTTAYSNLALRTGSSGTPGLRMLVRGQDNTNDTSGFIGMGSNLSVNFTPRSRLHLHHTASSAVNLRFTNNATGSAATDGLRMGIGTGGAGEIIQEENQNISIFTPSNITLGTEVERFRIAPNGQVFIGVHGDNANAINDNVIQGDPVSGFSSDSDDSTALLNIRGPIYSSFPLNDTIRTSTILYGYSNPAEISSGDGFRFKMDQDYFTTDQDALIIGKTDGNTNPVDGGIVFTNTGSDDIEVPAMYIRGTGRTYVGKNILANSQMINRFTIDSESGDGSKSGLRFIDLTDSETPVTNPGAGVLSVDSVGNVIYVTDGGGSGGPSGAINGTSVNVSNKVVLGQDISEVGDPAELLSDREIPMDGNQLNFNDGYVNVNSQSGENTLAGLNVRPAGTSATTHPYTSEVTNRALNVLNTNNSTPVGIDVYTEGTTATLGVNVNANVTSAGLVYGVNATANSEVTNGTCVGVNGIALGNNVERGLGVNVAGLRGYAADGYGSTYGLLADAEGDSQYSYGVFGRSTGSSNTTYGVYGTATSGTTNYGIYGSTSGAATTNYGVYGSAVGSTTTNYGGYFAASGASTNRAGYFAGQTETTAGAMITSDRKFKQNISEEKTALELLAKLRPVTYDMKTAEFPQFNFSNEKQHGFIAQEIENVFPELVSASYNPAKTDASGNVINEAVSYKSVNYTGLTSINTQAINELNQKVEEKDAVIKEQEKKIEDLNARLSQLENCLSALLPALCQMNQSAIEQNTPESQQALKQQLQTILSDRNSVVLTQNVPNPFAETTTIEYNIPATVAQAQIHFYDAQGKLIQSVDITTRGNGELKVFANDLSKGTYTYNLVADGKIVATKKMMKM
ncbi:MAG: tail fiber domain-containing protein [Bacteroidota bacterium]